MRVLLVIVLLVGATFIILFALTDLARDLLRHSHQASPDLEGGDGRDGARVAIQSRSTQDESYIKSTP